MLIMVASVHLIRERYLCSYSVALTKDHVIVHFKVQDVMLDFNGSIQVRGMRKEVCCRVLYQASVLQFLSSGTSRLYIRSQTI